MRTCLLAKAVVPFVTLLALSLPARAVSYFDAVLTGNQETVPNASPGLGYGTVELNNTMDTITVNLSFSGLSANATVAHIHSPAALGTNAGVLFPFSGFPNTTSGSISGKSFAITAAEVADLQAGLMYFNIHTSAFPAGEIRGQIHARNSAIPEPGSLALLATALPGALVWGRARRRRA